MVAHVLKMNLWKHKKRPTLQGDIVISVGVFDHSVDSECWENINEGVFTKTQIMFYNMNKRKIDMVDEIFVINVRGYVESVLSAFVTSSEETIFGNCFFEPIAIAVSGGNKALAEGIDLMIQDAESNTIYAIAVKSGPSVFNADSKKRQEQNFMAAAKLAQQAKARYEAYIGYCYGKKKDSGKGKPKMYQELAGKQFWTELTGDEKFYIKI